MRKFLIAAVVLAAGCDSTRRDFSVCDTVYSECANGLVCNVDSGICEPITDAAPVANEAGHGEATPPVDVTPAEVAAPDAKDAPAIDGAFADVPADVSITDVPLTVEVAPPDTRVPDAPGTCAVDNDCTGSGPHYCVNARCVACRASNQCDNDAGAPFCSAQNSCVSCASATGDGGVCSGTAPVCNPGSGRCVECVQNSECTTPGKSFCVANKCQGCNVTGASAGGNASDGGASDGGRVDGGGSDGGVVGPCNGAKPVCATSGTVLGQCVQCMTNSDCSGSTPICNTANTCVGCTSDTQCATIGPGICMFPKDGRCASDAETIYVQNISASCANGSSAGTSAVPFCNSQDAIGAVTSSKRVIVMTGSNLFPITSTSVSGSGPISIIGRSVATTNAGAAVGIHVTVGDVYVRGVTIAGGGNTGIVVEAGATLTLNRCIVKGNAGGGLIVNSGAEFEVVNSVFDANGPASDGQGRSFGGVLLLATPSAGKKTRFWFNTVLNSLDKGVVCATSTQALEGLLMLSNFGGDQLNCSFPALANVPPQKPSTSSDTDANDTRPKPFDPKKPYHLIKTSSALTTSPCIDFIWDPTVQFPLDDVDGDARPYGTAADCGADEYHP